jgi:hypothetical protein
MGVRFNVVAHFAGELYYYISASFKLYEDNTTGFLFQIKL